MRFCGVHLRAVSASAQTTILYDEFESNGFNITIYILILQYIPGDNALIQAVTSHYHLTISSICLSHHAANKQPQACVHFIPALGDFI